MTSTQGETVRRLHANEKLSRIVVHNDTVYLSGITADDKRSDTYHQTVDILKKADSYLEGAGTDRTRLLLALVFLRDPDDFDAMNRAWTEWLDGSPPPARATVGATFALPEIRVEIQFTAAL